MTHPLRHPARWLACGLVVLLVSALAPAGLRGAPIPPWSWATWGITLTLAALVAWRSGARWSVLWRRAAWLAPVFALFALPTWLWGGADPLAPWALILRAAAATAVGGVLALRLGAAGLVAALRDLRLPVRLVEIVEAMLVTLAGVTRQAAAMQRARAARRIDRGAWGPVLREPHVTVVAYGRLVAALLLRAIERAEALERARRARGAA